jgi:pyruvate dehydrogenase E2 component (dihydrolipoamide acetyltransferase)
LPSTAAGIIKSILVQQGDEVTEGIALIELESESAAEAPANDAPKSEAPKAEVKPVEAETKHNQLLLQQRQQAGLWM